MRIRPKLDEEYFKARSNVDANGCWIWKLSKINNGYGACFGLTAHKMAYISLVGPVPEGKVVRHSCISKLCCNPKHLLVGTQVDNYFDIPEEKRKELHRKAGITHKRLGYGKNLDGSALAHGIYRTK